MKSRMYAPSRRDILAAAAAVAAGTAFAAGPALAADVYKIGAAYAVSGPASFLGDPSFKAAQLAVERANSKGGIKGQQIQLVLEDGKSTETATVLAVRKLIDQEKVAAILGPSQTGAAMAVIPIANEQKVVVLPAVSGVAVAAPAAERKYVFRTGQGGDLSVGKVLDYAKRAGWKKIGVLYSSDAYGEDGRNNMRKLAPAAGITIGREESFPVTATDLKTQLTNLKGADLDAVFMHGIGAPSVVVYKNAKELDFKTPIISGHGQANAAFRNAVGDAVVGQPIVGAPILVWSELPDSHPQKAKGKEFFDLYKAKYGSAPDMFAGVAWDSANLVIEAMRNVGPDPVKIQGWLENQSKGFVGVTGVFNFSPEDHGGLKQDALVMMIATADGWRLADFEK